MVVEYLRYTAGRIEVDKMKLDKKIDKLLDGNRPEAILEELIKEISWNKMLLCLSNICVNKANNLKLAKDKTGYKEWMNRAKLFHKTMEEDAANGNP